MEWIKKIQENEEEWIQIIQKMGESFYAKDIVQEFYIKLMKYATEDKVFKDGKPNMQYLYLILRNIFLNYHKQKTKFNKLNLDEVEIAVNYDYYDAKETQEMQLQIEEEMSSWSYFDRELFKLYTGISDKWRHDAISMRTISQGSNISTQTIFYTLKRCKEKIREELGDDYSDFVNKKNNKHKTKL
jgi:RNA polymerase sigma factor (sigma-70 family)|tara:strand:+ start:154 stop:711 length:558 start_codon:yes stop_codon:yes gene_type:complete